MRSRVIVLLLCCAGSAGASLQLEPPSPSLGERALLELSAAPADSSEWPSGHGVVLKRIGDTRFELLPVRVGDLWVQSAGDTLRWSVAGSIETPAPERLRPLKSAEPVLPNWWPTALLALALSSPLLWFLFRLLRRPRQRAAFELPAEPPQFAALRELERIEASGWLREGQTERWYVEASQVLRRYLSGRYRVPALDWTSEETVEKLLAAGYREQEIAAVRPLLAGADGVKFAGAQPSEHNAQEWLRGIREFVHASAIEMVYSTPDALRAAEKLR